MEALENLSLSSLKQLLADEGFEEIDQNVGGYATHTLADIREDIMKSYGAQHGLQQMSLAELRAIIEKEGLTEVMKNVGGPGKRTVAHIRNDIRKARVVRSTDAFTAPFANQEIPASNDQIADSLDDLNLQGLREVIIRKGFKEVKTNVGGKGNRNLNDIRNDIRLSQAACEGLGDMNLQQLKGAIDNEDLENVNKNVGGYDKRTLTDVRNAVRQARVATAQVSATSTCLDDEDIKVLHEEKPCSLASRNFLCISVTATVILAYGMVSVLS